MQTATATATATPVELAERQLAAQAAGFGTDDDFDECRIVGAVDTSSGGLAMASQISFGGICGWCAGMASKQIGKTAAVVIGTGFIGMQVLACNGYVHVNWKKMEADVMGVLDLNKDGKVDHHDLKGWLDKGLSVCRYNMPSSAGFAGGFLIGIRYG
jgi:uncharacterized membrane protein (Fun14 family)